MVSATLSMDRWAGRRWICVRRYRLMLRVPTMTQAPQKRIDQAVMPLLGSPGVVKKRPACKLGIARSASLAWAEAAPISSAIAALRIAVRYGSLGCRDKYGVIMDAKISLEGCPYLHQFRAVQAARNPELR